MSKRLNILDLHRSINEKKIKRTECFEKVLETCHKKIKMCAETSNKLNCFYEVPEYIMGYPLFDLNDCIMFIMDALNRNGFLAVYYFPKFIYISWDFEEIERNKNKDKKQFQEKQILNENMQLKYKPSGKLTLNI